MKRRKNPTARDYPPPPDPISSDIDGIGEITLFADNDEFLWKMANSSLVKEAKSAVKGHYREDLAAKRWRSYVDIVSKAYRKEGLVFGDELHKGGHGFDAATREAAARLYQMWSEHQLFGRGMHHLLRLSQGDTSEV